MALRHRCVAAWALVLGTIAAGCTPGEPPDGPVGKTQYPELMQPFAGLWWFDMEKTLAACREAGATEEELALVRETYGGGQALDPPHVNLRFFGNIAISEGRPACEYWFFSLHQHGNHVCGKAWFHEDRNDPGDMWKCYVRLRQAGDWLHMEVRGQEGYPDPNDPDLYSMQVTMPSGETCDVAEPAGTNWLEWETFVFRRAPGQK